MASHSEIQLRHPSEDDPLALRQRTEDFALLGIRFSPYHHHPDCRICAWPDAYRTALDADLMGDEPNLIQIARQHRTTPRDLLRHIAACLGGRPRITPEETEEAIHAFADEIMDSIRRCIHRAEQILNDLYDTTRRDSDGTIVFPHRTPTLADCYAKLAKVNGTMLAGIVAHADRKRLQAQLEELEARLAEARAAPPPAPPERPRRSLAHLLKAQSEAPGYLASDASADAPDPFR